MLDTHLARGRCKAYQEKKVMQLNGIRDLDVFNCITFEETAHKYFIDGKESAKYSVTGLINKYKPKFEEDKWARIKAKSLNISVDEMKFIWAEKNLYSTTLGTELHRLIECVYTNESYKFENDKIRLSIGEEAYKVFSNHLCAITKHFKSFYIQTRDYLQPVANELAVGDIRDTRVCGTLDMLAYNKQESCFEIYDFKTNKSITYNSTYKEKYNKPLDDLEVCEFNTYCLQLSIYKYIIEKYTSLKIKNLYIVWFNADNTDFKLIPCNYLGTRVSQILS
jgi:hypothetical protein